MINEKIKKLRSKYHSQKNAAKQRGVEWKLTFQQWVDWWGDDIHRRGSGHDNLQMQRIADSGPYEIGNIRKGYPKDNSRTWAMVAANRKAEKAKREHQKFLDVLMYAKSLEDKEKEETIDDFIRGNGFSNRVAFMVDKK